ncbi:MAG: hypothetical protein RLZZ450_5453 [Pseudomonadota bacterium]|jgi:hypothetical protein
MNVQEFDTALSDLETRVDRLRALYENWFRGYEKLEPSVARKDVERRVYGLRKELPRNTALRFRYHQVYQRYTTLATYWQRTARQIEEGTYRLQLQRMKRRRPDDDARTIAPRRLTGNEGESLAPPSYELSLDETLDVRQLLDEIDLDHVARAIDVPGPHVVVSPPVSVTPVPASARTSGRFARPSMGPSPLDALTSSKRPPPGEGEAEATPSIPVPPHDRVESLRAPGTPVRPSLARPILARPSEEPRVPSDSDPMRPTVANNNGTPPKSGQTFAKPAALKVPPLTPPAMLRSAAPGPMQGPATGAGHRIIPPAPPPSAPGTGLHGLPGRPPPPPVPGSAGAPRPSMPLPPLPGAGARPSLPTQPTAPQPTRTAQPTTDPAPTPRAPSAPAARPPPPSLPAARPSQSIPAARPQQSIPAARPQHSIPAAATSAPARTPAPAAPAPKLPTQVSAAGGGGDALNEQRMRRIYDEYAAARKKNNEGDVRYETLASSIQKMLPDLSKKHQGKQIDFEVVLKDGRVGLKPKAT